MSARRRAPSLVGQVAGRTIAATLAMHLVLLGILAWRLEYGASELNRRSLSAQAAEIARALVPAERGLRLELPPATAEVYADPARGNHYAVLDRRGRLVLASPGIDAPLDPSIAFERERDGDKHHDDDDDHGERRARYFGARGSGAGDWLSGGSFPVEVGGRHYWIQVTQGKDHPDVLVENFVLEFLHETGWILLPFVLVLITVNTLTIRRGLAPLTALSREAATIGPRRLAVRLPEAGLPRELLPLVAAVNGAFDRLDEAFRLQRDFIADAAHELRTPLAILEAHLDALGDRAVAAELRDDVRRLGRLIGQLLRASELETLTLGPEERCDLAAVALDVARALAPLALREGKSIAASGADSPLPVHGNADALADAIRNLAENGLRYTPPGTTVEIALTRSPPAVHVRDAGPGVPEADRAHIFRRFWRADRRREAESGGLGLAIVARIAQAHGASLSVGTAPQGGAEFSLAFPSAPVSGV